MAEFKYLDIDCAAWIADTHHLTREARGLYWDMIVLCWMSSKCRLPNDPDRLAELLRCEASELPVLRRLVEHFWSTDRHKKWLTQKRLGKEWRASSSRRKQSFVNAKSRWGKEKKASRIASTATETVTVIAKPLSPQSGGWAADKNSRGKNNSRTAGTNPRTLKTNTRSLGSNPRAQGTNPRAKKRSNIDEAFAELERAEQRAARSSQNGSAKNPRSLS